jgi:hypothetical protein
MAEQVAQGAERCQFDCGGPRRGKTYPQYAGPLTPEWTRNNCVVCGEPGDKRFHVHGQGEIAACRKHFAVLFPEQALVDEQTETGVIVSSGPKRVSLYDLLEIDPVNDLGFEPESEDEAE